MKTKWLINALSLFFLTVGQIANGQELQVPGDDFSLEGALNLFKKSESPEAFERMLNSPDSHVNNLDLNEDGEIDYIRVIDRNDGNVHAFILQAIISDNESQDIAVIELEKLADGKAVLQITGDEDIYGIETIIEPTEEVRVNAGTSTVHTYVNVWAWPSVQYVYSPYYSIWISPWRWSVRPIWWHTWRPVTYHEYYSWGYDYRPHYRVIYTPRVVHARNVYRPYRTTSVIVHNRHNDQIAHYRSTHHDYDRGRGRDNDGRDNGRNDGRNYQGSDRNHSAGNQPQRDRSYDRGRENANVDRRAPAENKDSRPSVNQPRNDYRSAPKVSTEQKPEVRQNRTVPQKNSGSQGSKTVRPAEKPTRSVAPAERSQPQRSAPVQRESKSKKSESKRGRD